jgi:hypothetical protein
MLISLDQFFESIAMFYHLQHIHLSPLAAAVFSKRIDPADNFIPGCLVKYCFHCEEVFVGKPEFILVKVISFFT